MSYALLHGFGVFCRAPRSDLQIGGRLTNRTPPGVPGHGARTLDELLGDKGVLDREIGDAVRAKVEAHGLAVRSVGVKDVILPGEMKTILNQVVEAEKIAQANLIKRREKTAATRSLLNTARLMDENPTLLRLKELETLEKVTEKIDKLTVFGGLDGVLKDVVRIKVPSD
jgi:regulator of protease activity HflC (stomatin/prohibitin superfamily)